MEEELNQITETIDRIVERSGATDQHAGRDGRVDEAALALIEEAGLRRVAVSDPAGGWVAELPYLAVILKRMGFHAVKLPLLEDHLAAEVLAGSGADVPSGLLTASSRGDLVVTQDGSNYRANGTCRHVPWSRSASHVVALARSADGPLLVALPVNEASVTAGENVAGEPRDHLTFDSVAALAVIADAATAQDFRSRLLLYRSLAMLGAGERALDLTVTHVTDRSQFGSPLLKKQVVQHYIAEMFGALTAVRAACEAAVNAIADAPGAAALAAALATRIESDRMASTIARLSHQLHGAIGFTQEHQLHLFTTRLTAWRQDDLSETGCALELARLVLEFGGPWNMMTASRSARA